ncbi:hypothetical protein AMTRI_Chr08g161490 [Amborella trichopoda]
MVGNQVDEWTENILIGYFIGGPKRRIEIEVYMFQPTTLMATIGFTHLQEEKLQHLSLKKKYEYNWWKATIPVVTASKMGTPTIEKLTWAKRKKHRDRDPCHNCDKKCSSGHMCKSQQLFTLDGDINWEADDHVR